MDYPIKLGNDGLGISSFPCLTRESIYNYGTEIWIIQSSWVMTTKENRHPCKLLIVIPLADTGIHLQLWHRNMDYPVKLDNDGLGMSSFSAECPNE